MDAVFNCCYPTCNFCHGRDTSLRLGVSCHVTYMSWVQFHISSSISGGGSRNIYGWFISVLDEKLPVPFPQNLSSQGNYTTGICIGYAIQEQLILFSKIFCLHLLILCLMYRAIIHLGSCCLWFWWEFQFWVGKWGKRDQADRQAKLENSSSAEDPSPPAPPWDSSGSFWHLTPAELVVVWRPSVVMMLQHSGE